MVIYPVGNAIHATGCKLWKQQYARHSTRPMWGNLRHSRILDSLSLELGIWIPIVSGIRVPWAVFGISKPRPDNNNNLKFITRLFHANMIKSVSRLLPRPYPLWNPKTDYTFLPAVAKNKIRMPFLRNRKTSCGDTVLYNYTRNFCNLIGSEQWYFSLIWNTYMYKLQTFRG